MIVGEGREGGRGKGEGDDEMVDWGVWGWGKWWVGLDRIFGEGEGGYMERFWGYGGKFVGNVEGGDVDKIRGVRGVIWIEEKRRNKNGGWRVGRRREI